MTPERNPRPSVPSGRWRSPPHDAHSPQVHPAISPSGWKYRAGTGLLSPAGPKRPGLKKFHLGRKLRPHPVQEDGSAFKIFSFKPVGLVLSIFNSHRILPAIPYPVNGPRPGNHAIGEKTKAMANESRRKSELPVWVFGSTAFPLNRLLGVESRLNIWKPPVLDSCSILNSSTDWPPLPTLYKGRGQRSGTAGRNGGIRQGHPFKNLKFLKYWKTSSEN